LSSKKPKRHGIIFSFWVIEGELIRLIMNEREESDALGKAFSCDYQKRVLKL